MTTKPQELSRADTEREKMREKFEVTWCVKEGLSTEKFADAPGVYIDSRVDPMWDLWQAAIASQDQPEPDSAHSVESSTLPAAANRTDWQKKALDEGFIYWRAPDAHGVTCTASQAAAMLGDVLGVEVEIDPLIVRTDIANSTGESQDHTAAHPVGAEPAREQRLEGAAFVLYLHSFLQDGEDFDWWSESALAGMRPKWESLLTARDEEMCGITESIFDDAKRLLGAPSEGQGEQPAANGSGG